MISPLEKARKAYEPKLPASLQGNSVKIKLGNWGSFNSFSVHLELT